MIPEHTLNRRPWEDRNHMTNHFYQRSPSSRKPGTRMTSHWHSPQLSQRLPLSHTREQLLMCRTRSVGSLRCGEIVGFLSSQSRVLLKLASMVSYG